MSQAEVAEPSPATPGRSRVTLWLRALGWLLVSLPALGLVAATLRDTLGANPVETLTHVTGEWALRWLLLCLAITPLRQLLGRPELAVLRRIFGLGAFGYALLHFAVFLFFDLALDFSLLAEEVVERPYISVGFAALLVLTPLAITSTRGFQRRLARRWITLHRAVYLAAVLAVIHFLWLVKADAREPLIYAAMLGVLLGARLIRRGARC